jgi:hypothetical protein
MKTIREWWRDFWFEPVYDDNTIFGGTYNVKFKFRTQRLINIFFFIIIFAILFIVNKYQ